MEKRVCISSHSKVDHRGGNTFTQANEAAPVPPHHHFVHSQHVTQGMRCKQTAGGGQGSGKGTEAHALEGRITGEWLSEAVS